MHKDPLFEEAARLIVRNQKASTSFLQRKLILGFPRASRLIDQLKLAGIIETENPQVCEVLIKTEADLNILLLDVVNL
jgi:S-DNA-T family DNA segregation ATPase FtsK/SpoIIIE